MANLLKGLFGKGGRQKEALASTVISEDERRAFIQEKLDQIERDITELIETEERTRVRGGIGSYVNLNCGFCSQESMRAIIKRFASGTGISNCGFFTYKFPTDIKGPDSEPVWLIFDARPSIMNIEITTRSTLKPGEYEKILREGIYVLPLDNLNQRI